MIIYDVNKEFKCMKFFREHLYEAKSWGPRAVPLNIFDVKFSNAGLK